MNNWRKKDPIDEIVTNMFVFFFMPLGTIHLHVILPWVYWTWPW